MERYRRRGPAVCSRVQCKTDVLHFDWRYVAGKVSDMQIRGKDDKEHDGVRQM